MPRGSTVSRMVRRRLLAVALLSSAVAGPRLVSSSGRGTPALPPTVVIDDPVSTLPRASAAPPRVRVSRRPVRAGDIRPGDGLAARASARA